LLLGREGGALRALAWIDVVCSGVWHALNLDPAALRDTLRMDALWVLRPVHGEIPMLYERADVAARAA
jgi:hypothetical protein